jgi:hypothetical protein
MRAGQFESRQIMVEGRRFPGGCAMARTTVCSKTTAMVIVFCVAGVTGGRRAFEDCVLVALITIGVEMGTGQFEGREIMVKCGGFPPVC